MTHFPITSLVSAEIVSPDLPRHADFLADVWGLTRIVEPGPYAYFAGTGSDPYILAVRPGDAPALASITFRAASRDDLEAVAARADAAGCEVTPPHTTERPGGGTAVEIREPRGLTIRLIHGDELREPDEPVRDRAQRLAHVNINTQDVDALAAFYVDVLGFRLSDRSKIMSFVRCNSDHHTVVIADAPCEGLNHIAFLLPELDGVMYASGRMIDHGYPIGWGVGRHGPGDNVFAYFVDPMGFVLEHTSDVLQVDDAHKVGGPDDWVWPPGRTDRWGIAPPKSEATKAAQIAVPFAR